jgi:hypothetical protein
MQVGYPLHEGGTWPAKVARATQRQSHVSTQRKTPSSEWAFCFLNPGKRRARAGPPGFR